MLFQIQSRTDFAALGRLYRRLLLFSPGILIFGIFYLGLCSLSASYFFFSGTPLSGIAVVVTFFLCLAVILLRYALSLSSHKKRILESHHREFIDSRYEVYPDAILAWDSTGTHSRLDYQSIRVAQNHADEIFLVTKAKLVYILPKSGFVAGRPEDFLRFLNSRYVKVKL